MALHILQLGPYPPPEGGISRNMLAIRDESLAQGHECSIIVTSKSSRESDDATVYYPRSAFALLKLLATIKFDVLHLHIGGDVTPRVLMLAFAASIFGHGKSVFTLHSGAYPLTKEGLAAKPTSIRGFIFRRFRRIVAVNNQLADVFRRYGVTDDRIKVVPPFSPQKPDDNVSAPAELTDFLGKHSPVLLAVGGLEKDYDPLFQIAAMGAILNEFPNAGMMIVGDGSMRTDVERAVSSSGYADNVYIAGNVEHAVTLHLIKDADILLRTTLFDGDAISVREALFLGTPVIATDNGMRPDGVYLISMGNSDALCEAVSKLLSEAKKAEVPTFKNQNNIQDVLDFYSKLAG